MFFFWILSPIPPLRGPSEGPFLKACLKAFHKASRT